MLKEIDGLNGRSENIGPAFSFPEPAECETRCCNVCGEEKELDKFAKAKNGRARFCKACDAARARRWWAEHGETQNAKKRAERAANPEPVRAQRRRSYWRNVTAERRRARDFAKTERGRELNRAAIERYRVAHPERLAARRAVKVAIRSGEISVPPVCQAANCNCRGPLHAHHSSYAAKRQLDVDFVCRACHEHVHHIGPLPLKPGSRRKFARAPKHEQANSKRAA